MKTQEGGTSHWDGERDKEESSIFANRIITGMPHYASKRISEAVRHDKEVISLSIGEPWFGPPRETAEILARLATNPIELAPLVNRYPESLGLLSLRSAISDRYDRLYGLAVDPNHQVLVTHGAAEAIWLSILACTEIEDEILIGDPSYMLYEALVRMLGRVPVRVKTGPQVGFCLTAEQVEEYLSPRARMLILNSPENPTGSICGTEQLQDLLALARQTGILVLHDEVYDAFAFEAKHIPAALLDPEITIMTNSFSKKYGMPGWRLGWMVARRSIIELASKVHNYFALACAGVTQYVAAELLQSTRTGDELVANAELVRQRSRWFADEIIKLRGFTLPGGYPKGGLFLFVNVNQLYEALVERGEVKNESPGEAVADLLLKECKIAVVPGKVYGAGGEDYIRIVVAVEQEALKEAQSRLQRFTEQIFG